MNILEALAYGGQQQQGPSEDSTSLPGSGIGGGLAESQTIPYPWERDPEIMDTNDRIMKALQFMMPPGSNGVLQHAGVGHQDPETNEVDWFQESRYPGPYYTFPGDYGSFPQSQRGFSPSGGPESPLLPNITIPGQAGPSGNAGYGGQGSMIPSPSSMIPRLSQFTGGGATSGSSQSSPMSMMAHFASMPLASLAMEALKYVAQRRKKKQRPGEQPQQPQQPGY